MKKVYGSYVSTMEARRAVDELLTQGYSRDEIKVVSNQDLARELSYMQDDIEKYKTNLQAGEVLVLVEEGSSAYRDHFRDGVPDWDEREEEFNED